MSKLLHVVKAIALVSLVAAGLSGCGGGGGGGTSGDPVAQVAGVGITRTSLNHWMSTILGGDFYEISHRVAPTGLVSDPPDYATCIAGLERLASSLHRAKLARAQLKSRCEQLYQAVKQQAVAYLITAQVAVDEAAEQGLKATPGEVERYFKRIQATEFPTETALAKYLADRHWSLSDELFLVKRDLLSTKLRTKLEHRFSGAAGQERLIRFVHQVSTRWTARTTCRPGYVVEGCSDFTSAQAAAIAASPSAAVLIEELAG